MPYHPLDDHYLKWILWNDVAVVIAMIVAGIWIWKTCPFSDIKFYYVLIVGASVWALFGNWQPY